MSLTAEQRDLLRTELDRERRLERERAKGTPGRRADLAVRAAALRAEGKLQREIADELGISRSYAAALVDDPDGLKDRSRKDSYRGECEDCGRETDGGNGPGLAPARCGSCARQKQHDERWWTAERVIDAIRRFAAEHGRPPTALEWRRSDPEHGYPAFSTVYRPGGPFASWADAIEAAGFPRPGSGRRTRHEGGRKMQNRSGYMVLRSNDGENWKLVGESSARTQTDALTEVLNGGPPDSETVFVCVPGGHWAPRRVTAVQKVVYEWADA